MIFIISGCNIGADGCSDRTATGKTVSSTKETKSTELTSVVDNFCSSDSIFIYTDTYTITEIEILETDVNSDNMTQKPSIQELSVEERIRQLSDNNIRLMDINTRKYSSTNYEVAPDGSYAIYEFGDIDTYSEYIELMYDTYTRDVADIFIYYKYGFDSLEDRLVVYSERNITIINNVHWEDYQFEIISLNDTECVFECTSWNYIDNYVSNGKEYTTHKCTAVKCEDGKWRLTNSFF